MIQQRSAALDAFRILPPSRVPSNILQHCDPIVLKRRNTSICQHLNLGESQPPLLVFGARRPVIVAQRHQPKETRKLHKTRLSSGSARQHFGAGSRRPWNAEDGRDIASSTNKFCVCWPDRLNFVPKGGERENQASHRRKWLRAHNLMSQVAGRCYKGTRRHSDLHAEAAFSRRP